MDKYTRFTVKTSLLVALGGFLMGFDASVISGVVSFIETEFSLTKIQLGWSVACLTLTASLGMMVCGPLSDRFGRRAILRVTALVFAVSAVLSALAPNFTIFVFARMLGGFGVGAALIIAPIYIAEIAPAERRGRLVSFNQLNIVLGLSVAFFTNYLILKLSQTDAAWVHSLHLSDGAWRWMLGIEAIPACLYFIALYFVPESPRWLVMQGRETHALDVLKKAQADSIASVELATIQASSSYENSATKDHFRELFTPAMRLVLVIGVAIAILQQITGINAVFFYAPMIFEQTGIGTDASFLQAILVGLVNLVFTIVAILFIDKIGRKPLLIIGVIGIALCMLLLAYGFSSATYTLSEQVFNQLPQEIDRAKLGLLIDQTYFSDLEFTAALKDALGESVFNQHESVLLKSSISINSILILIGILGFVASFAMSLGPVMWVLFSELFPNRIRGVAISFVGLINSGVSFLVQLVFPVELAKLGNSMTFFIYAIFALIGLFFIMKWLPETKGKSLEQLEQTLVKSKP